MQNLRQNLRHFYFFIAVFNIFLFIKYRYFSKAITPIVGPYSYTNVQSLIKICKEVIDIERAQKNCIPPIFKRRYLQQIVGIGKRKWYQSMRNDQKYIFPYLECSYSADWTVNIMIYPSWPEVPIVLLLQSGLWKLAFSKK